MSDFDIGRLQSITDASPNFFGRSPLSMQMNQSNNPSPSMSPLSHSMHNGSNEPVYQPIDHLHVSNEGRSSYSESNNQSHNQSNNQSSNQLSPPLGAMGFMKEMNGPPSVKHANQSGTQASSQMNSQPNDSSHSQSTDGFSMLHPASPVCNSSPSPNFGFEASPLQSPAMVPLDRSYHSHQQPFNQSINHSSHHGLTTAASIGRIYSQKKAQKKNTIHSFLSSPSPVFSAGNPSNNHSNNHSIKQSPVFSVPPRRSPRFAPNSNFLTSMSPNFFGSPTMSFTLPPSFTPLNRPGEAPVRRSPRLNPSANHSMNQSSGSSSPFQRTHSPFTRSLMDEQMNQSNHQSGSRSTNQSLSALSSPQHTGLGPQTPMFPPLEDPAHGLDSPHRANRSILRTMHSSSFYQPIDDQSNTHSNTHSSNQSNSSSARARKRRRSSVDSAKLAVMPQFTPELTGLDSFYGDESPRHSSMAQSYNQANNQSSSSEYTLDMNGNLSSPALLPFNSPEAAPTSSNQSTQSSNQSSTPSSTPGSHMSVSSSSSIPSVNQSISSSGSSAQVVPAGGNGSGSSCHQCKSRRSYQNLIFCSNMFLAQAKYKQARDLAAAHSAAPPPKLDKKSICRKKYCETCLVKFYSDRPPRAPGASTWTCPACRDVCCCAACRRQKDKSRPHDSSAAPVPGSVTLVNGALPPGAPPSTIRSLPIHEVLALAIVHLPQWGNKFTKQSKSKHRNSSSNMTIKTEPHVKEEFPSTNVSSKYSHQPSPSHISHQMSDDSDHQHDDTPQKKKKRKKSKKRRAEREKRRDFDPSLHPSIKQEDGVSRDGESSSSALSSEDESQTQTQSMRSVKMESSSSDSD